MSTEREIAEFPGEAWEKLIVEGDLSRLNPAERVAYYGALCRSLGLNPLTRPFEYIVLNGKLTLYARRDAADQLRRIHGISIEIVERKFHDDIYMVVARGVDREGRRDEAMGAVYIGGLRGQALADALLKAETKAKRRVTLSLAGLGLLDETEVGHLSPVAAEGGIALQEERLVRAQVVALEEGEEGTEERKGTERPDRDALTAWWGQVYGMGWGNAATARATVKRVLAERYGGRGLDQLSMGELEEALEAVRAWRERIEVKGG